MNTIRNTFGWILGLLVGLCAAPTLAQTKAMSIDVSPTSFSSSPTVTALQTLSGPNVTIMVTNETPASGNSTINSFIVWLDGATIADPSTYNFAADNPGYTMTAVKRPDGRIAVNGFTGLKSGRRNPYQMPIKLRVSYGTPTCGQTYVWDAIGYTGNFSQEIFSRVDGDVPLAGGGTRKTIRTQKSTVGCAVSFTRDPQDAIVNQGISGTDYNPSADPVEVVATNSGTATAGVSVTLSATGTSCTTSGSLTLTGTLTQTTDANGKATFPGVKSTTAGVGCSLTATRSEGASSSSASFKVVDAEVLNVPKTTSVSTTGTTTVVLQLVEKTTSDTKTLIEQNGTGTITITAGTCTFGDGLKTKTVSSTTPGILSFSGLEGVDVGQTCTLTAEGTFGGDSYGSTFRLTVGPLTVYEDVISCNTENETAQIMDWSGTIPEALPPEQFDGSEGVNSISDVTYYKGARGANDTSGIKKNFCYPVPYTVANNVAGSADATVQGKTIPKNGAALFWDELFQPNATFRTVTTFSDEWTTGNGWIAKRTKICLDDSCTEANRVKLKVCLGTALKVASMPTFEASDFADGIGFNGYAVGDPMPACIVAEVFRAEVPDDNTVPPSACTLTSKPGANAACIRTTTELLIVGDPIWNR